MCWCSKKGVALVLALAVSVDACSSDHDCSLNGECTVVHGNKQVCICDAPWTGESCQTLAVLPVNSSTHPGAAAYGFSPNVSSWGGSILRGQDGRHHMYVAQMKQGGLIGWGSVSECIHAVSDAPSGPFMRRDVVLSNECHGPVVIPDPVTQSLLMFHIGTGNSTSGFMHHSATPDGPWVASRTNPGSCGMPTAAFHPNGTLFVVCGNGQRLSRADQGWQGEWIDVMQLNPPPMWEDPSEPLLHLQGLAALILCSVQVCGSIDEEIGTSCTMCLHWSPSPVALSATRVMRTPPLGLIGRFQEKSHWEVECNSQTDQPRALRQENVRNWCLPIRIGQLQQHSQAP